MENKQGVQPKAASVEGEPVLLAWLAENRNCELSFDYGDDGDGLERWCIHRVNGGINDREWTLIGWGATPEAALSAARNSRERL